MAMPLPGMIRPFRVGSEQINNQPDQFEILLYFISKKLRAESPAYFNPVATPRLK
jgi:hypothetical protein